MAGWFEAFSNFAHGAAPALDRYQTLRRLDEKSLREDKQQTFENTLKQKQFDAQQQLAQRQQELTDLAILGKQQELATANLMPGQDLDPQGIKSLQDAQLGSLVNSVHQFNPMEQTAQHSNPLLSAPQYGLGDNGVMEQPNTPVDLGAQFQMPDEARTDFDRYRGTGPQQMEMYKAQAPDRQRALMMAALGKLDLNDPQSVAMMQTVNPQFDIRKIIAPARQAPTVPGGTAGYLATLQGPDRQNFLTASRDLAQANHIPTAAGGQGAGVDYAIKPGSQDDQIAGKLGSGEITPTQFNQLMKNRGAQGDAARRAIVLEASNKNPDFNYSQFESEYKYATDRNNQAAVTAVNSVKPNIDKFIEMLASADNGSATGINKLINQGKLFFGNKKITALNQMSKIVGDELGVALGRGTVTDQSRALGIDLANFNLDGDNALSNMLDLKGALDNRLASFGDQAGVYKKLLLKPGAGQGHKTDAAAAGAGNIQYGTYPGPDGKPVPVKKVGDGEWEFVK